MPAAELQYSLMTIRSKSIIVLTQACKAAVVCDTGVVKSKCHNPDSAVWWPNMMSWSLNVTVAVVAVKLTSHPASRNWPIRMRGEEVKSGTMCPCHALRGNARMSISALSWVEYMMEPFRL